MDCAVCLVKDPRQGRRAAAIAACVLAMGLAACSSPMPPWQPPRTVIEPAPPPAPPAPPALPAPAATLPPAPSAQPIAPAPVSPAYTPAPESAASPQAAVGMPNPASTYCLQRGGELEFSTRAGGAEVGTCVSPRGDECEQWAFLRGSCTW